MSATPADSPSAAPMSQGRKALVLALAALLTAVHLFDIATFEEHWPSSRYAMYAFVARDRFSFYVLYGVRPDGSQIAINSDKDVYPFLRRPLNVIYENMIGRPAPGVMHNFQSIAGGERKLSALIRDVARRYAARHPEAQLRAARLYRVTWRVELDASARERPIEQQQLLEIQLSAEAR